MKAYFTLLFFFFFNAIIWAQARLEIQNNSDHNMHIKVMDEYTDDLYKEIYMEPYSDKTIYFSETGHYYLKTKATKSGYDPIYKKGDAFRVYNGADGYSVLTLTYTINRTSSYNPMRGETISKTEFDKN